LRYQRAALARVSRTFALTIPQLPQTLRDVVGNAYLLCRLADTIEDDPGLDRAAKGRFMTRFVATVHGKLEADTFARELSVQMSAAMSPAERDLVEHTATVLEITARLAPADRQAVARCVEVMGGGMPAFQRRASLDGLANLRELDLYCYYVAGVVGEMLTELFCGHSQAIVGRRDQLLPLAVRFGKGLQLTNILKDIWEDRKAGICWLPQSLLADVPGGLGAVIRRGDADALTGGIRTLIGIAHAHLRAALEFTALIPRREVGIRRFCLWAIGLALLTLRKIHQRPGYRSGSQVKISRRAVRTTILTCNAAVSSNQLLRMAFALAAFGLPLDTGDPAGPSPGARLAPDGLS
jgi:farnesyl-diphosphate farnesyltransferase